MPAYAKASADTIKCKRKNVKMSAYAKALADIEK
jgi:hypothetical protein